MFKHCKGGCPQGSVPSREDSRCTGNKLLSLCVQPPCQGLGTWSKTLGGDLELRAPFQLPALSATWASLVLKTLPGPAVDPGFCNPGAQQPLRLSPSLPIQAQLPSPDSTMPLTGGVEQKPQFRLHDVVGLLLHGY